MRGSRVWSIPYEERLGSGDRAFESSALTDKA